MVTIKYEVPGLQFSDEDKRIKWPGYLLMPDLIFGVCSVLSVPFTDSGEA
jgi:hypothetical protein